MWQDVYGILSTAFNQKDENLCPQVICIIMGKKTDSRHSQMSTRCQTVYQALLSAILLILRKTLKGENQGSEKVSTLSKITLPRSSRARIQTSIYLVLKATMFFQSFCEFQGIFQFSLLFNSPWLTNPTLSCYRIDLWSMGGFILSF